MRYKKFGENFIHGKKFLNRKYDVKKLWRKFYLGKKFLRWKWGIKYLNKILYTWKNFNSKIRFKKFGKKTCEKILYFRKIGKKFQFLSRKMNIINGEVKGRKSFCQKLWQVRLPRRRVLYNNNATTSRTYYERRQDQEKIAKALFSKLHMVLT